MLFLLFFLMTTVEQSQPGPEDLEGPEDSDIPQVPISSKHVSRDGHVAIQASKAVRMLELRSEGGAGEYKGGYLGRYTELEEKSQER